MEEVILQKVDFEFSVGTFVLGYPELKENLKFEIKIFQSYVYSKRLMRSDIGEYLIKYVNVPVSDPF